MTLTELKPCPMCEGEAEFYENTIDFVPVWGVQCRVCNLVQDTCASDHDGAAEEWNRRVPAAAGGNSDDRPMAADSERGGRQDEPDDLAARMKAAGMRSLEDMLGPYNQFQVHSGMTDMAFFETWLESKTREYQAMQVRHTLNKTENDDMYEWVLAHASTFHEVLVNYRAAKPSAHATTVDPVTSAPQPESSGAETGPKISALEKELAEAKVLLKPFAKLADDWSSYGDDFEIITLAAPDVSPSMADFTVADLKAARTFLDTDNGK